MLTASQLAEIEVIASRVRENCELFALSCDPRKWSFARSKDLNTMCAVASAALKSALRKHGYHTKFVYGEFNGDGHCWLEYRGYLIDITATQFDFQLPRVVILPRDQAPRWITLEHVRSWAELGFEDCQQPTTRVVRTLTV